MSPLALDVAGDPAAWLEPSATGDAGLTRLRGRDGTVIVLDVASWTADANDLERRRLATVEGPVLDIGCGPGRLVVALAERGVPTLGVDASRVAVGRAVRRDAPALVRSVFDPVPGAGRWRSALLFDGNIGIGGDPARLLQRAAQLLAPGGRLLVEIGPPGVGLHRFHARVERGGARSSWFPWARVGVDAIEALAAGSGFRLTATTKDEHRWFAELEKQP
ncbi:MAG: class I SAM-dependent methyltransferase [Acidimicrobiales bacterium]